VFEPSAKFVSALQVVEQDGTELGEGGDLTGKGGLVNRGGGERGVARQAL